MSACKERYRPQVRKEYLAVLNVLVGIRDFYNKRRSNLKQMEYCYPAQETILAKLREYHGIDICRRTLNRWLARMAALKVISRVRRLTRGRFMSTAYYVINQNSKGVSLVRKEIGRARRLAGQFKRLAFSPHRVTTKSLNKLSNITGYDEDHKEDGPSSNSSHILNGIKLPFLT